MDSPEIRALLAGVWQNSAQEAIQRGMDSRAVAETMLSEGLAILVGAVGREGAADALARLSQEFGSAEKASGSA